MFRIKTFIYRDGKEYTNYISREVFFSRKTAENYARQHSFKWDETCEQKSVVVSNISTVKKWFKADIKDYGMLIAIESLLHIPKECTWWESLPKYRVIKRFRAKEYDKFYNIVYTEMI